LFSLVTILMIPKYNNYNYNSPPAPPTTFCRRGQDGTQECFDVNSWLSGRQQTHQQQDNHDNYQETVQDDDDDDYLVDDKEEELHHQTTQQECQVNMDGTCIPPANNRKDEDSVEATMVQESILMQQQEEIERERQEQTIMEQERRQHQRYSLEDDERLGDEAERRQRQQQLEAQQRLEEEEDRLREEANERQRQQQQEAHHPQDEVTQEADAVQYQAEETDDDWEAQKKRLQREREDREKLHLLRNSQQQPVGKQDKEHVQAERERLRKEREEQLSRRDEFRERELQELEDQRRQREQREQEDLRKLHQQEDSAEEGRQQPQHAPKTDDERFFEEFWAKQRKKQQQQQQQKQQREEEESKRQQVVQEKQEEQPQRGAEVLNAKGFGSFTPGESGFVEPKGFESFGTDALYRPRGFKDLEQRKSGGLGANLPMGFGSFGKEDAPPKGVAGGGLGLEDHGGLDNSGAGGGGPPDEPAFTGKPFAPRDMRKAAASRDFARLKEYVEQRPDWVDKKDKNGWSPLHLAIRAGHKESVELLLGANADINGRTAQGITPLGVAMERVGEDHPITEMLRKLGGEM
jgi:Ankyrin repeat